MKTKIKNKQERGITLIALVVTIVVLLILAGVSISLVLNNNGVISKAKDAKNQYAEAQTNEEKHFNEVTDWIDTKVGDITGGSGTVTEKPETTTPDTSVSFSTAYGRIDVVWLDKSNNVINNPLEPVMMSGMTKVAWNGTEEITPSTNTEWYSYTAQTGTTDGKTSKWANAKNDGSYFVWIPRYAYRITYYSGQSSTDATGYYDGFGMWSATDKKVKYALDTGAKTVVSNGKSYIVHPAFETDINLGGWDSQLSGIWVAKYEMSMETSGSHTETESEYLANITTSSTVKAVSKPNVSSWRYINIGNVYTNSYNYDRNKESHLMKNSEWGAVAYLTQSQYGRNGNEIDINNSTSYITGNGGGSTSAIFASGTTNAYNTANGQKASTTGNIYGIYDMSGGAWEYVAAFNDTDSNNYETTYGSSFAGTTKASTKYATKYSNNSSASSGTLLYTVGKTGDSTKEVYVGSGDTNWFSDSSKFLASGTPFFMRCGHCNSRSGAGVFYSAGSDGNNYSSLSFRVVLAGV